MDKFSQVREIPLVTVFGWLGVDLSQFKTRGKEQHGKCPFHKPKNNSTSFSFTDKLGHCFGCGVKFSGAIDAVKLYRQCNFTEAVKWLQEQVGSKPLPPPQTPVVAHSVASSEPLKPFTGTYHQYQIELPWLEARCDKATREKYGVFAYGNPARKSKYQNKVFIPLKDLEGVLYGYLVRTPEPKGDEIKYEFPPAFPKSRFLFGAAELRQQLDGISASARYKELYLLESPFACMKFASLGLPAVSSFGWSVSEEQIALISQLAKGVLLLPDRNKRQECVTIAGTIAKNIWVRFPPLPDGIDDPEYLPSRETVLALTSG